MELIFLLIALPIFAATPVVLITYFLQKHIIKEKESIGTYNSNHYVKQVESSTFILLSMLILYIAIKFKTGNYNDEELPGLFMFLLFSIQSGFYFIVGNSVRAVAKFVYVINYWMSAACFWIWVFAGDTQSWGPNFG